MRAEITPSEPTKEIRVIVRLKNNRLLSLREKTGLSMVKASEAMGIRMDILMRYENLQMSPVTVDGEWIDSALQICIFYKVAPDWIWTDATMSVRKSLAVREIDAETIAAQLHPGKQSAQLLEDNADFGMVLGKFKDSLRHGYSNAGPDEPSDKLSDRDVQVLSERFGLGGGPEYKLHEIGEHIGVSRESVRHIECSALQKIKKILTRSNMVQSEAGPEIEPLYLWTNNRYYVVALSAEDAREVAPKSKLSESGWRKLKDDCVLRRILKSTQIRDACRCRARQRDHLMAKWMSNGHHVDCPVASTTMTAFEWVRQRGRGRVGTWVDCKELP